VQRLLVVVTMDCERPNETGLAGVTGAPNWALSARYIEHYASVSCAHGFPVSFFCHPEVTRAHADLLFALERQGCNVDGLHLHPWKYEAGGAREHLGHMSEAAQRAVLTQAIGEWSRAMRRPPRYFRPGTFSANDATFRVATELGFIGGSLSVPGRIFPDLGAVWAGCPADPHLAHPEFRILPGSMPFANMPLTVDAEETRRRGVRQWNPDFRPDQPYDDLFGQVQRGIAQIIARQPAIPVFNIVTHNDNDYSDPGDPVRRNLEAILSAVRECCTRAGIACEGATIEDICERVFRLNPSPPPWVPV
jgi:hypothetical protein